MHKKFIVFKEFTVGNLRLNKFNVIRIDYDNILYIYNMRSKVKDGIELVLMDTVKIDSDLDLSLSDNVMELTSDLKEKFNIDDRGKIYICSLSDFNKNLVPMTDETRAIVRSLKDPRIIDSLSRYRPNVKQLQELSPSKDLFFNYLSMRDSDENWFEEFSNKFYEELKTDVCSNLLDKIKIDTDNGISYALFCFCSNVDKCHRLLIGKELESRGCEVVYV